MSRVYWHGNKVTAQLQARMSRGVKVAALTYNRELQQVVGVSAGGNSVKAKAIRGDRGHKDHEKYRHSRPGEPPRKITGFLQRNIVTRFPGPRVARVGLFVNAIYGYFLERGTKRIAQRPWVVSTLLRLKDRLGVIVIRSR